MVQHNWYWLETLWMNVAQIEAHEERPKLWRVESLSAWVILWDTWWNFPNKKKKENLPTPSVLSTPAECHASSETMKNPANDCVLILALRSPSRHLPCSLLFDFEFQELNSSGWPAEMDLLVFRISMWRGNQRVDAQNKNKRLTQTTAVHDASPPYRTTCCCM